MQLEKQKQQKFSVVVVEDDESIGEMLVMLIKEVVDCQVYYFTRGSETLQAMQQQTIPDLFILDYHLPSMTGIQLYDRLQGQKELCNVPTIMISANLPRKELETRHIIPLEKPFEIDELLHIINNILL